MANYYLKRVIEKDEMETDSVGTEGPSSATPQTANEAEFRMLDDDENVYYYGRIFGDYEGFEPTNNHDFGMPYSGCVDIQYKEDGKWISL